VRRARIVLDREHPDDVTCSLSIKSRRQSTTPHQPEAVAGWSGSASADHQMRPEEGKNGASRAPCAAFVSQPSTAASEARSSRQRETTVEQKFTTNTKEGR